MGTVKKTEVREGSVSVTYSCKVSERGTYGSQEFGVNLTLAIKPGQTPEKALEECDGLVDDFFSAQVENTITAIRKKANNI